MCFNAVSVSNGEMVNIVTTLIDKADKWFSLKICSILPERKYEKGFELKVFYLFILKFEHDFGKLQYYIYAAQY